MEIKTNELAGAALDWAVAKCEGCPPLSHEHRVNYYTSNWSLGGPIIEREKIGHQEAEEGGLYQAWLGTCIEYAVWPKTASYAEGPTPLIAAMRCYVASKLGDTVSIPKELQCLE